MSGGNIVQNIVNLSIRLFNRQNKSTYMDPRKYSELLNNINKVRGPDLGLDKCLAISKGLEEKKKKTNGSLSKSESTTSSSAATNNITYIHVFEDSNVSIGIFILKSGEKIPLHNHPKMRGLLKCVYGRMVVTSYSLTEENKTKNDRYNDSDNVELISAIKHDKIILGAEDNLVSLTPHEGNIHEIEIPQGGGPVAFLDVLAPPYNMEDNIEDEIRDIDYFVEVKNPDKDGVFLKIIDQPDYQCDQEPYKGLPIY